MAMTLTTAPKTSTFQFVVTRKSKAAKFEQAVNRLMSEIVAGEESVGEDGWIDEADILSS